jgi:hypothetical protein
MSHNFHLCYTHNPSYFPSLRNPNNEELSVNSLKFNLLIGYKKNDIYLIVLYSFKSNIKKLNETVDLTIFELK